ncbi:Dicer-like protein 1 [Borealophlyctis nickersoniae]|nr:Dicer-like protein 1 [Borealophlyctis nickersoniae]
MSSHGVCSGLKRKGPTFSTVGVKRVRIDNSFEEGEVIEPMTGVEVDLTPVGVSAEQSDAVIGSSGINGLTQRNPKPSDVASDPAHSERPIKEGLPSDGVVESSLFPEPAQESLWEEKSLLKEEGSDPTFVPLPEDEPLLADERIDTAFVPPALSSLPADEPVWTEDKREHEGSVRLYQLELLNLAKDKNVIAVLDTGAGKTLIAVLLIKHMMALEGQRVAQGISKRLSIFLVPLVPLVVQQERYIRQNCDLEVKRYYGAMNVDSEIASADVMVMTPDIFRNILERAFISMKQVNLIVFDEAHHARRNHSYSRIVADHYMQTPEEFRPKIFGMTASPSCAKEDASDSVGALERNLCCKAFTTKNLEDLARHVHRPEESVIYYDDSPFYPLHSLYLRLHALGGLGYNSIRRKCEESLVILQELGPWCANVALRMGVEEVAKWIANSAMQSSHGPEGFSYSKRKEPEPLRIILENVQADIAMMPEVAPGPSSVSPKVMTLMKVLEEYKDSATGFCGMVFVQRRLTARVLTKLFRKWKGLEFLKVEAMVGHGTGRHNNPEAHMNVSEQRKIVEDFGAGITNLLFATQVAEEGLDIQPCMLVIRFDMFSTLTNYIQSRGRARHPSSRFVILARSGDTDEDQILDAMRADEKAMREELQRIRPEHANEEEEDSRAADEIYTVAETGASVAVSTAIRHLYQYCDKLPKDAYCSYSPEFFINESVVADAPGFFATVTMPLPVPVQCRHHVGSVRPTKREAKRIAAFEIVRKLHAARELDDRLRPMGIADDQAEEEEVEEERVLAEDGTEMLVESVKSAGRQGKQLEEHVFGTPKEFLGSWVDGTEAWLSFVQLSEEGATEGRVLDVGFLTASETPMPGLTFAVPLGEGTTKVKISCHPTPIPLRKSRLEAAKKVHFDLFAGLLRSGVPIDGDWCALAVPIHADRWKQCDPSEIIDWETIDFAFTASTEVAPLLQSADLTKHIFVDRVQYNRKYLLHRLVPNLTPFSEFPLFNAKFSNVAEFYQHRLSCQETILPTQPIIEASPLPHITQTVSERSSVGVTYLIPQFCTLYPVPSRILEKDMLHIPLILRQLHHRLLVSEFKGGDGLSASIPSSGFPSSLEDLEAALTTPSANLPHNYERLETLGDSFLKAHQSIHLFAMNPNRHEGYLSQARNIAERNSSLHAKASEIGLARYVLSTPLSRRTWVPPERGDAATKQSLNKKALADVVEAVIGACTLEGGVEGGATAVRALLGDVYEVDWSKKYFEVWKTGKREVPDNEVGVITKSRNMEASVAKIEARIGYSFKNPDLLVEALTHPSSLGPVGLGACYQRLEFLGDAVLNYLTMRHLYSLYPALDPGGLTDLRSELVNNQFLACISCAQALPKHMEHMSGGLAKALEMFGSRLEACMQETTDVPDQNREASNDNAGGSPAAADGQATPPSDRDMDASPLFWNDLPLAPKAAGDLYEALLGAVVVDSEFDVEPAWKVIQHTLLDPWWNRFEEAMKANGGSITVHATREMFTIAADLKCTKVKLTACPIAGTSEYRCKYTVHDKVIGTGRGVSKREAKRAAATVAYKTARAEFASLQALCTCQAEREAALAAAAEAGDDASLLGETIYDVEDRTVTLE